MSRAFALSIEQVRQLREWRTTPRGDRKRTLEGMAAFMGISRHLASRAAYGMRGYEKVQP